MYSIKSLINEWYYRTSFSIFCWKCTMITVPTANSEVPANVSFEARDMLFM